MARESIKKMLNHKTGDITSRYVHANVNSLRPMFDEIAQGLMLNYDGSYLGDAGFTSGKKFAAFRLFDNLGASTEPLFLCYNGPKQFHNWGDFEKWMYGQPWRVRQARF